MKSIRESNAPRDMSAIGAKRLKSSPMLTWTVWAAVLSFLSARPRHATWVNGMVSIQQFANGSMS